MTQITRARSTSAESLRIAIADPNGNGQKSAEREREKPDRQLETAAVGDEEHQIKLMLSGRMYLEALCHDRAHFVRRMAETQQGSLAGARAFRNQLLE